MITLSIDGRTISLEPPATILDAAKKLGIEIPTLCHIPGLDAYGGCRVCMVEVEGSKTGFAPACATPVAEGMVVRTDSPEARSMRGTVLEMILSEHDADCFNCKKMGACDLHRYCRSHGILKVKTGFEKRRRNPDASHPFYTSNPDLCILCGKCVRTCAERQCSNVLSIAGRGQTARIVPDFGVNLGESSCVSCGNCVAACPVGALLPKERSFVGYEYVSRVPTICPYCGVGCAIELLVTNGKVVGVEPSHGPANEGLLCVKGRFAHSFIHHADRLKKPLVRVDGNLVEASWEEALERVATAFREVRDGDSGAESQDSQAGHDPESGRKKSTARGPRAMAALASARCTNEENYVFQKLYRLAGRTNNIDHCARLCHASTVSGLVKSLGSGAMTDPIAGIDLHDVIFVTGSNTTETHPVIGARIKRAVMHGAKLVVADPRAIELATLATVYLPLKPGTNVALYNALARSILDEGLEDASFIAQRTEGFEELRAFLGTVDVAHCAAICGLDESAIRKAARLYAQADKAGIYYAMGVTQHTAGTDGVTCLSNLAMMCGKLGKPGCGINPLRGQNNVQGACDMGCLPGDLPGYRRVSEPRDRATLETAWGHAVPAEKGLTSTAMFELAEEGRIGFMHIMGENPVISEPDSAKVAQALDRIGFLVVQDIFLTETAAHADVVLPAACFAEKDGSFTNTERRVQRVRKAVEAPGEAREDLEILLDLAERVGMPDSAMPGHDAVIQVSPNPRFAAVLEEIARVVPQYGGILPERIEHEGLQWPCPDPGHPGTPTLHREKMTRGKGRFIVSRWHPPAETEDAEYPLVLTTGRNLYQYHTRTMTGRVHGLTRIAGQSYIEVNPGTTAGLGLKDGDLVRVSSRRGSLVTRIHAKDSLKPGVVFMPFHYVDAMANLLTNAQAVDPEAAIPELKACAVRLEPVTGVGSGL